MSSTGLVVCPEGANGDVRVAEAYREQEKLYSTHALTLLHTLILLEFSDRLLEHTRPQLRSTSTPRRSASLEQQETATLHPPGYGTPMWAMSYQKLKDLSPEASERVIRFLKVFRRWTRRVRPCVTVTVGSGWLCVAG